MIRMTYDEYDALVEKFEKIKESGKVIPIWPTIQQVDEFQKDPEKWMAFCCYLHEFNPEPKTAEEKYSRRNLSDFINSNLELYDPEEDAEESGEN